ncbi:cytochrome c oxidase accessory protein CcoG [Lacihabitans sp. LS3-19]|uniref:cytochrome c oxidase accessory protein CcoG n=1 Tax=Lacihabitans sp. LS3-19 TaxID=2487335 RepID=UPI0020CC0F96|nr:cytochrome c oxidase accessory protein CcoG [Lacihabitans sp. LS3-19]MCP9766816.1 cytochrome c oxidase accessory protein CcoG [Lacihabitans sp. LS3-19]
MENLDDIYKYVDSEEDEYRNTLATVDKEGKRIWLYPKMPKGPFFNKRVLATIAFLIIFLSGPFIKINGLPLLMMNVFERKFVIFGQLFLPQDFIIFGLGMISFVVFIILFTVTYGRIWCGWLCPQTVFMEMIFRPIEVWLEGEGRTQKKFDESPMNFNKAWRKTVKHIIYITFSIVIAHFTMAYLVGLEKVKEIITRPPSENLSGFIGLVVFTGLFYFVFAKLREQVCIAICPYGRLQGVLVTKDTMTIIYDDVRGEPRGRISKKAEPTETPKGDCVDCGLCVQVCPTGIDIRNGIQLECVNCTACIDVCDEVMEKVGKPKGLIRYASVETIKKGIPFKFTVRTFAYSMVLVALISVIGVLLLNRTSVETTLMRVPGQLYQEKGDKITNLYNAQMVNKSNEIKTLTLGINEPDAEIKIVGPNTNIQIKPGLKTEVVFFVEFPKDKITKRKTPIKVQIYENKVQIDEVKTNFQGPN